MKGQDLIQILVELSGLPEHLATAEVHKLAAQKNKSVDSLTLDDLRIILSNYLQDVLLEAKKSLAEFDEELDLVAQD